MKALSTMMCCGLPVHFKKNIGRCSKCHTTYHLGIAKPEKRNFKKAGYQRSISIRELFYGAITLMILLALLALIDTIGRLL